MPSKQNLSPPKNCLILLQQIGF